uniref:Uncharacterized protein n=1 Tax=Cucumis melo TaxID=3656 RepID=A0A9I9EIL9_CUCME
MMPQITVWLATPSPIDHICPKLLDEDHPCCGFEAAKLKWGKRITPGDRVLCIRELHLAVYFLVDMDHLTFVLHLGEVKCSERALMTCVLRNPSVDCNLLYVIASLNLNLT